MGSALTKMLEAAGCTVEFQEYGRSFNLLASKKGSLPHRAPLLLSAHMDTIEPTEGIVFSIGGDLIRTTGNTVLGADDKSALAQIIEALTVLQERTIPHGDLEIVFTSAEEKGLRGAKNLVFRNIRSRHALVLDSGGAVGRIVVAAPTHLTYEMKITGKSAHAGIEPEKGISAIKVASRIIAVVPDGRIDDETTANIGMIRGGTATNVVPRETVIQGEIRSHRSDVLEKTRDTIFHTARRLADEHHAAIIISEEEEYKAFKIDAAEPFLPFLEGVFRKCGIEPVYVQTGGGSDANVFNEQGIIAINISTGMEKVHSTDEYISLKDLYDGSLIVLNTVAEFGQFLKK